VSGLRLFEEGNAQARAAAFGVHRAGGAAVRFGDLADDREP
jgi:hypothetical protein